MKHLALRRMVRGALIAALYVALTLLTQPIAFGALQIRLAEAMTVLPFILPEAIPGLTIGCLLSNMVGGYGILDVVFGTLATFLAALATYKIRKVWLAPLPPVLLNAVIVGWLISFTSDLPSEAYMLTMASVGIGETLACYVLGLPLLSFLAKSRLKRYLE